MPFVTTGCANPEAQACLPGLAGTRSPFNDRPTWPQKLSREFVVT